MAKYNHIESIKSSEILSQISEVFKTEKERTENKKYAYFDTFDWRLYKNKLFLIKDSGSYTLSKLSNNKPIASLTGNFNKNLFFWWEFPEGRIKNELKNLIGVRALIPLATVTYKSQVFKLLNKDEKIVLRITFQNIIRRGNEVKIICLDPVRGYQEELKKVKNIFSGIGLKQNYNDILSISLQESSIKPGSYTGKLNIKLKPEMSSQLAAVEVFRNLLNTIKQNEDGIKKDIDTEFLHDFRVAARRTRAALSQIKGVFSDEVITKAKKDFSTLGKLTNYLRDLDVYLLTKEKYIQMLPADLQPGLEPVFKRLETERRREQKKLALYLNSSSYKKITESWEKFLLNRNFEDVKSTNSDIPVIKLAKQFILRKYKKIIKAGKLINDRTPDPEIHSLRIECKKLRYLLEFFSSLFPKNQMTLIIDQLKKLQDNLGDFNDLYVQQESLKSFLSEKENKLDDNKMVNTSVGGLIAVLYEKQKNVRNKFKQKFEEFSKTENIKLYKKLFS